MQPYTIGALPTDKIDQAYPVAVLAFPGIQIDAWRLTCRPSPRPGDEAGELVADEPIMAAIDTRGYIHGLCRIEIAGANGTGLQLETTAFVVAAVLDVAGIAAAMLRALVELCRRRECSRLVITVPSDRCGTLRALAQARDDAAALCGSLAIELLAG